jgi:hypothetical protein
MEAGQDNSPKLVQLPLQERALANGMLHSELNKISSYKDTPQGRIHSTDFDGQDFKSLVEKFKNNPKDCLAVARENLLSIKKDTRLSHNEQVDRIKRYLDAYFNLQIKLDHEAFPPSEQVIKGIPDYIPDGLSDMGSDPSIQPGLRTREKLRVNKQEIFEQSKEFFFSIFSYDFSSLPPQEKNERIKKFIAKRTGLYVYKTLSYDHKDEGLPMFSTHSTPLSGYADRKLAVCRQQALYTQVLLQAFGLTSRLVKSDVSFNGKNFGPHVNNAVRIEGKWYVMDTTNPEQINLQQSDIFIKPVPETDIDLNKNVYKWSFANAFGTREYITRNNMHYRIRDNIKNPAR